MHRAVLRGDEPCKIRFGVRLHKAVIAHLDVGERQAILKPQREDFTREQGLVRTDDDMGSLRIPLLVCRTSSSQVQRSNGTGQAIR